jgi:hypothetical protein
MLFQLRTIGKVQLAKRMLTNVPDFREPTWDVRTELHAGTRREAIRKILSIIFVKVSKLSRISFKLERRYYAFSERGLI